MIISSVVSKLKKIATPIFRPSFQQKLEKKPPLLVLQMGKVASTSVYFSLRRGLSERSLFHAHQFDADHSAWKLRELRCWLQTYRKPIDIISLVREPVGRNVSAFFQNFERETSVPPTKWEGNLDELFEAFYEKYDHQIPEKWFDQNIKKNFDIDVFSVPFETKGWMVYIKNNVRLLVLKVELGDSLKEKAISDFLGMPSFKLVSENVGSKKDYDTLYGDFKREVKLPESYVDDLVDSRYFKHFYPEYDISTLKDKWCSP